MPASRTGRANAPAFLGAAALLIGVFGPLARVDLYGDVTFLQAFEGPGTALVIVAAAAVLAVFRRARWLPLLAPAAWLSLLWPVLGPRILPRDENLFAQLGDAVQQQIGNSVGDVLLDASELSWGPWVLLAGCVLLTVAALRTRGR